MVEKAEPQEGLQGDKDIMVEKAWLREQESLQITFPSTHRRQSKREEGSEVRLLTFKTHPQ